MPNLKLLLLGPPRIEVDGELVEIKRRKALALLTYLAVTGEAQRRDTLATLLWPDSSQSSARAALRRDLSILNKALGGDWLAIERETIGLQTGPNLWLDAEQFQQHVADCTDMSPACLEILTRAAKLYRDDFLTGFTLPDCPDFDEWQFFQAEGLRQELASVLERLVGGHSAQGDYQQAIPYARRWLALDSLHESAHRHLMQLYAWDGQQAAALRQYNECVRILEEEVGALPSEETTRLYESIKTKRLPPPSEAEEQSGKAAEKVFLLHPRTPVSPHNLPAQTTAFIGRITELAEVRERLSRPEVRLLTLTGPGGTGKTRLGLQAAANTIHDFTDGVFFVTLAPISDSTLVDTIIAQTLGVRPTGDRSVVERLKEYLRDKQLLLVLDNFEHVLEAAPIITELLGAAPNLKVMVTSRALLRLSGEWDYPVPPLNLPDPENLPPLERLAEYEAVQMFNERAAAVKPNFALTGDNALVVVEICVKLDGLPLAIELAAARIRLLPPQKILAQLSNRLKFLTGGSRDLARRQQTLRNAIDWSYDLLEAEDQLLFQRLAVFAGGCTFEAAEAVGNIDGAVDVLNGLESLVDKNLLKQSEVRDEPRFGMLETIREYGLERLTAGGRTEALRQIHSRYFMELAEEAEPHMYAKEQLAWVKRLETEHDNLRTALQWSIENDVEMALRIGGALGFFWHFHSHHAEGRDWLLRALAKAEDGEADLDRFRAKALNKTGYLAFFLRNITQARTLAKESVALWRQLDDEHGLANALCDLGPAEGDPIKAQPHLEESVSLFRKLGDKQGLSRVLFWQGLTLYQQGDNDSATSTLEEGISVGQEVGDFSNIGSSTATLGLIAFEQGDFVAAQSNYEAGHRLFQEVEDKPGIALALSAQAEIAYIQGEYDKARALLEEDLVLWQELGSDHNVAEIFCDLGYIALHHGKLHRATNHLERSINLFQTLNADRGLVQALAGLARVAEAEAQMERAARLIGTIEAIMDRSGMSFGGGKWTHDEHLLVGYQTEYKQNVAAVRAALGDEAFEAAYAKGQAMSLEEAVAYALER